MDSPLSEFLKESMKLSCIQKEGFQSDNIKQTLKGYFEEDSMAQMGETPVDLNVETLIKLTEKHPEFKIRHALKYFDKFTEWKTLFALHRLGSEMDQELRTYFIGLLKNDMFAFNYYLKASYLTDKDDHQLEEIFKGKIPQAEQELKDGIVSRRKYG